MATKGWPVSTLRLQPHRQRLGAVPGVRQADTKRGQDSMTSIELGYIGPVVVPYDACGVAARHGDLPIRARPFEV